MTTNANSSPPPPSRLLAALMSIAGISSLDELDAFREEPRNVNVCKHCRIRMPDLVDGPRPCPKCSRPMTTFDALFEPKEG